MAIIIPLGLTAPEIRVLQEFRRLNAETLPLDKIKAIKHPAGGGEAPAVSLVDKGYLTSSNSDSGYTVTQKGKDFLAIDAKPSVEETGSSAAEPDADVV